MARRRLSQRHYFDQPELVARADQRRAFWRAKLLAMQFRRY
jgi:hypothetical protein